MLHLMTVARRLCRLARNTLSGFQFSRFKAEREPFRPFPLLSCILANFFRYYKKKTKEPSRPRPGAPLQNFNRTSDTPGT
jgi:hypothetical protein